MFYKSNISFEKLQETFLSRELYCISLSSIFKKYLHVFLLCPLHFPLENMSLIVLLYLNMFWIHEWSVQFVVRIIYFFPVLHIQRYIYILWWFACVWVCNVLRTLLKQLFFFFLSLAGKNNSRKTFLPLQDYRLLFRSFPLSHPLSLEYYINLFIISSVAVTLCKILQRNYILFDPYAWIINRLYWQNPRVRYCMLINSTDENPEFKYQITRLIL